MSPVIAPPIEVSAITAETDRFKCRPYNCVLMASACIRRQDMLAKPRNERTGDYVDCEKCEDGALIRVRLKLGPADPAAGKSKHGPSPSRVGASPKPKAPPKKEVVPDMPKPQAKLLLKSKPWERPEPSLPPNLAEIPDLPPPVELPPPPVTRRHPAAVVFDEAPEVSPARIDGITPVIVSGEVISTAPLSPPVVDERVALIDAAYGEARTKLAHIDEVFADMEKRVLGLADEIRATRAKLAAAR